MCVGYLTASLPTLVSFTCCLHVGSYNDTRITLSNLIAHASLLSVVVRVAAEQMLCTCSKMI